MNLPTHTKRALKCVPADAQSRSEFDSLFDPCYSTKPPSAHSPSLHGLFRLGAVVAFKVTRLGAPPFLAALLIRVHCKIVTATVKSPSDEIMLVVDIVCLSGLYHLGRPTWPRAAVPDTVSSRISRFTCPALHHVGAGRHQRYKMPSLYKFLVLWLSQEDFARFPPVLTCFTCPAVT